VSNFFAKKMHYLQKGCIFAVSLGLFTSVSFPARVEAKPAHERMLSYITHTKALYGAFVLFIESPPLHAADKMLPSHFAPHDLSHDGRFANHIAAIKRSHCSKLHNVSPLAFR
jgi:hypothetical protein